MSQIISRRGVLTGFAGVLGIGAVASLAGCAGGKPEVVPSDDAAEPAVIVRVVDNAFEPAEVEIAPGEAVQWVFEGRDKHDVVADDGSFVSELVYEGSYTRVFEETGEYGYDCSIHPEMRGVVRVVAL